MRLPFAPAQFFDVFRAYNTAIWPLQWLFYLGAMAAVVTALLGLRHSGRVVAATLAVFWSWLALVYHLAFFWRINPAAPWFAGVSLLAAAMFGWQGVYRDGFRFERGLDARKLAGVSLTLYALVVYPLIGVGLGHPFAEVPTLGLPCPTTLFTFGLLLLAARPIPRMTVPMPMLWAAIGATAAFSLGVLQDYALLLTLVAGVWLLIFNRAGQRDSRT